VFELASFKPEVNLFTPVKQLELFPGNNRTKQQGFRLNAVHSSTRELILGHGSFLEFKNSRLHRELSRSGCVFPSFFIANLEISIEQKRGQIVEF